MPLAQKLQQYLEQTKVPYEVVMHRHTATSLRSANQAHIEANCLAKAVMLEDDRDESHHLMAVVPANHRVQLTEVAREAGRPMHLASEKIAATLFPDCEAGAFPPVGPAYGIETIWEDSLMGQPVLYFEAGDHERLVRVKAKDFLKLLPNCLHGHFSKPTH
ncbi:MAG: aminoacyl-tRNA deacylase [Burkholderiales bacterium]